MVIISVPFPLEFFEVIPDSLKIINIQIYANDNNIIIIFIFFHITISPLIFFIEII